MTQELPTVVLTAGQLLDAGLSYRHVADLIGVEKTRLRRTYPGRSRPTNPGRRRRWDIEDEDVLALRARGLSFEEIAHALNASKTLVRGRLWLYGLAANPWGERPYVDRPRIPIPSPYDAILSPRPE